MGQSLLPLPPEQSLRMRSSLVLLVSLALLLSLFLPAIEAAAARRKGKATRRGRVASSNRQQGRRGKARGLARQGRQDEDVAEAEEEEEIYNGCDPATNIGGFLIQRLWRKKCVELEYTNFGGYGGIPAEEEEEEGA